LFFYFGGEVMGIGVSLLNGAQGMTSAARSQEATARNVANGVKTDQKPQGKGPPGANPPPPAGLEEGGGILPSAPFLSVDLGREMTNMAMSKAAYEANAKVVEVSRNMLEKTIDLEA